jgi:hypothetical protein
MCQKKPAGNISEPLIRFRRHRMESGVRFAAQVFVARLEDAQFDPHQAPFDTAKL